MFEKHKFIGDFPMFCRGSAIYRFTNPRPTLTEITADPRPNSTMAVCLLQKIAKNRRFAPAQYRHKLASLIGRPKSDVSFVPVYLPPAVSLPCRYRFLETRQPTAPSVNSILLSVWLPQPYIDHNQSSISLPKPYIGHGRRQQPCALKSLKIIKSI